MLGWHIDRGEMRSAGTILFTWTDEWFLPEARKLQTGVRIVTRSATEEGILLDSEKLGRNDSTSPHLPLPKAPFVSSLFVVQRGRTLGACLNL